MTTIQLHNCNGCLQNVPVTWFSDPQDDVCIHCKKNEISVTRAWKFFNLKMTTPADKVEEEFKKYITLVNLKNYRW